MIQRIQSLFLLLSGVGTLSLFQFPFANTDSQVEESALFADGIYNVLDHIALIAVFSLAGLLAITAVFLFKNRKLQANLSLGSIAANIAGVILTVLLFMQDSVTEQSGIDDGIGAYLPFVGILCAALGVRFIRKDEKLVRSMDRLR
ncbi:MAG: DUF4293 domain-containing protein [Bacteroidota bacterium]